MIGSYEWPKISTLQSDHEDKRLSKFVNQREACGWAAVVGVVTAEICKNPGWIVDARYPPLDYIKRLKELLEKLQIDRLKDLDSLDRYHLEQRPKDAFVLRFMEIFSQKYNFPYVWRGGSLDNLNQGVTGTFTFIVGMAKSKVSRTYDDPRKEPCLIALPITALVEHFKKHPMISCFVAEHGYDGMFNTSFDISLPGIPEGTMIYQPD